MTEQTEFVPSPGRDPVSALFDRPSDARALYVIAHGAGAGMRHAFLEEIAGLLTAARIATFRYQFPYMEEARRRPDTPKLLTRTVRSAIECALQIAPDLPVVAGGKSMGGRMTSQASSAGEIPGLRGLIFLGFPLHAPGRNTTTRADHLQDVALPMLFLQGTRDALADIDLIRNVCDALGDRATLEIVASGDHSFKVLKRSGRTHEEVMTQLRDSITAWIDRIVA